PIEPKPIMTTGPVMRARTGHSVIVQNLQRQSCGDIRGNAETEEMPRIFVRGVPDFLMFCG
ncbi:MAG: hypothetical protein WBF27_21095, partial [Xanthobacteraceae bacterium]